MPDNLYRSALGSLIVVVLGLVAVSHIFSDSIDKKRGGDQEGVDHHISALSGTSDIAAILGGSGSEAAVPAESAVWLTDNPGAGMTATFDRRGVEIRPDQAATGEVVGGREAWRWGLDLLSYGIGTAQIDVGWREPAVRAESSLLSYDWDGNLEEWYRNDERGVEHGYTIRRRPNGGDGRLQLRLRTRGALQLIREGEGRELIFGKADGEEVLRYGDLKVFDAQGAELEARFLAEQAGTFQLVVDDDGALYPLTIDPLISQPGFLSRRSEWAGRSSILQPNTAPAITPASGLSRTGGSASTNSTIATVSDAETAAGSLTVSVTSANPSAGVTISGITNTNGTITANLAADCGASAGTANFTLEVSDGTTTTAATLSVVVNANLAPTLSYGSATVSAAGATTINPLTGPTDNGSVSSIVVQSAGTYTGSVTVDPAGIVSITGAAPVGSHTITIQATDNCGTTAVATIALTVNSIPTITPVAGLTRTGGMATWSSTIATVNDAETPVGNLAVVVTSPNPAAGVTITNITNNNGSITADIFTACAALAGTASFTLQVSDGAASSTATLSIAVNANTAPSLSYSAASVNVGSLTLINPAAGPTDNGVVNSVVVQSKGTYTGSVTVNTAGTLSISGAAPVGVHTLTIRATDNCGVATDATIQLTVNAAPVITAAGGVSRTIGSSGGNVTIATVSDNETSASSLVVTVTSPNPAGGVTISNIANTNGTITADLATSCGASLGTASFTLQVSDGTATSTDILNVAVGANTAPVLSYGSALVNAGGATVVSPATGPSDNGAISSIVVLGKGTFTGTVIVDLSGLVSISGAAPAGNHTITIRTTDNCGTTTDSPFALTVNGAPTITAASGLARTSGTPVSNSAIATVGDAETAVGSLTVNVVSPNPAGGVMLSNIINNNGTITADLVAACGAAAGSASFTLQVSDGTATSTTTLNMTVNADPAPTLTYSAATVNAGGATTINPASGPLDNGNVATIAVQSQGTYTGTVTVNAAGVVSISGAAPAGTHTITIRATDNCGIFTDATISLAVNGTPTITAAGGISRTAGSALSNSTIATVGDPETAAGSLTVTVTSANPSGGVTISNIANSNGTITADLVAACGATAGAASFTLQVSDGALSTTTTLNVTVVGNTAPVLTYAAATINAGATTNVNPATGPLDNGSVSSIVVQSQGTYTGTVSVNAAGVVSISGAAPPGTHTITIRATDNCGATTDATLALTINGLPVITASGSVTRTGGSPSSNSIIATVSDNETPAGSLVVTVTSANPSGGVTLSNIVNNAGTVTADLVAACGAVSGPASFTLEVSDGAAVTTTTLNVAVIANTPPTLSYALATVNTGGALTVNPATGPSDNGAVSSIAVQGKGGFTGTVTVDAMGVVSISGAAPAGTHSVIIRATDSCGGVTDAILSLRVNAPPAITAATGLTRTGGTATWSSTIATVIDAETPPGNLTVVVTSPTPSGGISLSNIANNNGTITADLVTACSAPAGTASFTLEVSDGASTSTAILSVNVNANTPPTMSYNPAVVAIGGTTTINPSAGPTDNGSINQVIVQNQGTYTGVILVNSAGVVSISAAAPAGSHAITIRVIDNCGSTTDVPLTLNINGAPAVTVATGLTRIAGSSTSNSVIATVSDLEVAAGALTVAVTSSNPTGGVTLANLVNNNGTVTADINATCAATPGLATFTLQVSDGTVASTATLQVQVTPNTQPTLTYGPGVVNSLASTTINPLTGPSDNGTISSVVILNRGTYTGTVTVNSAGNISISGAYPTGTHNLIIRATDNCGAVTDATLLLTVNPPQSGPGNAPTAAVLPSQQKPGSLLIYSLYTSSVNKSTNDTEISLTNTNPVNPVNVHLFFVDGGAAAVSDQFVTLTQNQTLSFLASDIDPEVTGYMIAVAIDADGCPIISNYLIGRADVRFTSGHHSSLPAIGVSGLATPLQPCTPGSVTATLSFNGVQYDELPRTLTVDSLPSPANGNSSLLVINRIGGDLADQALKLDTINGLLFDDSEISRTFTMSGSVCQLRGILGDNFPRTQPRYSTVIPAGRTGWMKFWANNDHALTGVMINKGPGDFSGGYNLPTLTTTNTASLTIPVVPVF